MATYSPNVSEAGAVRPTHDDEIIHLRPIIDTLLTWWQEILLLTIAAAVMGSGIALFQNFQSVPVYEASAQVAMARIVSRVNLDSSFQTEMNRVGNSNLDSTARRISLLGLVKNGTIAAAVIQELSPLLDGENPSKLLRSISADFVGDEVSDLIEIKATADTPEMAAAIVNAWARLYVEHINTLYGELPTEMAELVEVELQKAKTQQDAAQQAYEEFLGQNEIQTIARQIGEKKQLIATLQQSRQVGLGQIVTQTLAYRNEVIRTYLDAVQQNRLLAFAGEQEANRNLVQTLIQAITDNRQLAFTTDNNARIKLFNQYAERELENRLLAMQQEQNAKTAIFEAYSDADLKAKLAIFNEQTNNKVQSMIEAYASKRRMTQLLDQATALQKQVEQAGAAGARTNSLSILLLKIEVYAASGLTDANGNGSTAVSLSPSVLGNVQLDVTGNNSLDTDIENQATDLAVLIDTLSGRIAALETRIEQESLSLFNNEGYQLLDGVRPQDDELYAAMQKQYLALFEVDALAQTENGIGDQNVLSQAIIAKYNELFGLGSLTSASLLISDTTPIYVALESQYPSLFTVGDLTQLGDTLATDSALDLESQAKIFEMLQPFTTLESYLAATETSAQPILQLESELSTLEATLEHQMSQRDMLMQVRDNAREAYATLTNKQLELTLQRTAGSREVRLAATANPPDRPVPSTSWLLAGVIFGGTGFALAILLVLFASYMDVKPLLSRLRPPQVSVAGHLPQ